MALEFKPQFDKIVELLLYLAHKNPGASKYQAVKFFYFADREHLAQFGRPISFDTYYALWYGPVASNAMDLIENDAYTLRLAGIDDLPFNTEIRKDHRDKNILYITEPKRSFNEDLFSDSDIQIFDAVIEKYKSYNFEQLMRETHAHEAYMRAWSRRGDAKSAKMSFADMIEDKERRMQIVDDFGPVSSHMR